MVLRKLTNHGYEKESIFFAITKSSRKSPKKLSEQRQNGKGTLNICMIIAGNIHYAPNMFATLFSIVQMPNHAIQTN